MYYAVGAILDDTTRREGNIIYPDVAAWKRNKTETEPATVEEIEEYAEEIEEVDDNIHLLNEQRYDDFWLQVEMTDGSWWELPAKIIAYDRANYFSDKVSGDSEAELREFTDVLNATILDEDLLIDWAEQNVKWDEVADFARLVRPTNRADSREEGWRTGMKQVVDRGKPNAG